MALKMKSAEAGGSFNEMNVINAGTMVEGTIETKGSLRIEGKVKGVVRVGDQLTIGKNGEILGEVYAKNGVIGGKIEGDVHIEQKLVLETTSSLVGNLSTSKLIIDEGAHFNGKSAMGGAATGANGQKRLFDRGSSSEDAGESIEEELQQG